MEPMREQIAPEIVEAIIALAAASGLSVDDYLRQVLGLKNGESIELASNETSPRNEEMLEVIRRGRERLKDLPVHGSTEDTLRMIREARGGALGVLANRHRRRVTLVPSSLTQTFLFLSVPKNLPTK
jgi:hypothetical protein